MLQPLLPQIRAGQGREGLANRIKADTNLLGGVIAMRGIKAE